MPCSTKRFQERERRRTRSNHVKHAGRLLFILQNHGEVPPARRPFLAPRDRLAHVGRSRWSLQHTRFHRGWPFPAVITVL